MDSGRKVYEKILAQGGKPEKTAGIVLSREEVAHLRRYLLGLAAEEEIAHLRRYLPGLAAEEEIAHLRRYLLGLAAEEEIAMFGGFGRAWRIVSALRDQRPCMIANCTIGYEREFSGNVVRGEKSESSS